MRKKYKLWGACQGQLHINGGRSFLHACPLREAIFFFMDDFSRGHAVKKHLLVGGYLTTIKVFLVGATAGVFYREAVSWWEGPLYRRFHCYSNTKLGEKLNVIYTGRQDPQTRARQL